MHMLCEWWSNLSSLQQAVVFVVVFMVFPFFLLLGIIIVRYGYKLPINAAGGELCMVAVGLDIALAFSILDVSAQSTRLLSLFVVIILIILHVLFWIITLYFCRVQSSFFDRVVGTGTIYFIGVFAFNTALVIRILTYCS